MQGWKGEGVTRMKWIPFELRELTDEEKILYPEWSFIFDCPLPEDGQKILISRNGNVFMDTFYHDEDYHLDSDCEIENGMAWMPLPEGYKENENGQKIVVDEVRSMMYIPINAVEAELTFKIYDNGQLRNVTKKMNIPEIVEAISDAKNNYIGEDDLFVLTDTGQKYLEEIEKGKR